MLSGNRGSNRCGVLWEDVRRARGGSIRYRARREYKGPLGQASKEGLQGRGIAPAPLLLLRRLKCSSYSTTTLRRGEQKKQAQNATVTCSILELACASLRRSLVI